MLNMIRHPWCQWVTMHKIIGLLMVGSAFKLEVSFVMIRIIKVWSKSLGQVIPDMVFAVNLISQVNIAIAMVIINAVNLFHQNTHLLITVVFLQTVWIIKCLLSYQKQTLKCVEFHHQQPKTKKAQWNLVPVKQSNSYLLLAIRPYNSKKEVQKKEDMTPASTK